MAGEWKSYSLDQLYEFSSGLSKPRSAFGYGHPFLSFKDIFYNSAVPAHLNELVNSTEQERAQCSVRRGDVFLTRTSETMDELGMSCVALQDVPNATFNGFTKRLRPKSPNEVVPEYARYYFRAPPFRQAVTAMSSLSTRASLNNEMLSRLSITLPSPEEQAAIAHILGALDDKIELNRRMSETLEAMAQAIFKSWLVDFDPVRAKAEGRDPGLPKQIADLFPDRFENSELGEIPEGWDVKTIGDVAERVGMGPFGSSIKVETFVPEGVPIISGQHLNGFMLEDNKFNFITVEHAERLSNSNVKRGDVVFTHAGNIGQAAFIPECSRYERYVLSQRQFFMRCNPSQVTPIYVAIYFNSPEGQHQLLANASSSGVPSIARPVTYLRTIKLVIPSKSILDIFEKLTCPMLLRCRRNFDESETLATLRDKLLPKLISGELRIRDSEDEPLAVGG